jgi:membrane-bound serine protease (ClpP class)
MVDEEIAIPGVVERGKLLSLSAAEAQRIGYAEGAESWEALMARIGAPGARVVEVPANWAERAVRFLTHPLVAPFLLTLGFLGLLVEMKTPSFGLAGAAGLASLALFFGSHLILGLAGWETVILFAGGIALLAVEAFVLPGFGVAGVLGGLAVVASLVLSMVGRMPTSADLLTAALVVMASLAMLGVAVWMLVDRLPRDGRMALRTSTGSDEGYVSTRRRVELVGMDGVAVTDLRPSGTAQFGDERVDVVSEGTFVEAGTAVRVVRADGYRHVVRPLG